MDPSDEIIQLITAQDIGDTQRLNVHRGILCKSSKFFQNAMKPEWTHIDAGSHTIDMRNDPVDTVSDYIKWLYHDKMPINLDLEAGEVSCEKRAEEAENIFVALTQAYVFGEKIIDVKYKNAVLQKLFAAQQTFKLHMGTKSIEIIYEGTPPESPLRCLFAEVVGSVAHCHPDGGIGWMQFFESCPREALVDALQAMARVRTPTFDYPGVESYLEKW